MFLLVIEWNNTVIIENLEDATFFSDLNGSQMSTHLHDVFLRAAVYFWDS